MAEESGKHPSSWRAEAQQSLQEHGRRVWQRAWAVIVSGIGAVLGLITLTVPSPKDGAFVPTWLWVGLLVGGVLVAQFLAFHDVRMERDELRDEMQRRFDAVRFRFQMDGLEGHPVHAQREGQEAQSGYTFWLTFSNGGLEPIYYEVEDLSISIGGQTAASSEQFASAGGLLVPGAARQFYYHWISAPIDTPMVGEGNYIIRYGHAAGGQQFQTKHRFQIGWNVMLDGTRTVRWITQGPITHESIPDP